MITIFSPEQYKTIPWKNDKGKTTELAINNHGTIDHFIWRLSIASVIEDGAFSNFEGYERHLILIKGNGLSLTHDDGQPTVLSQPLSIAAFDGGSKTVGTLVDGPIFDFNLMTKKGRYDVDVQTFTDDSVCEISGFNLCFIYALSEDVKFEYGEISEALLLSKHHLLKLDSDGAQSVKAIGKNMIVITLKDRVVE